ncbi:MAG: hypothetical protein ACT4TC_22605 [Myxococcaceae bacterium]
MCVLIASSAFANPRLTRGLELISDLNYPAALTELQAAKQVNGNPRETVLKILAAQGVATASMSQPENARAFFIQLLVLDPDYTLPSDYSPKVMTPFYEARAKAQAKGSIQLTGGKTADALLVDVEDPLSLVNKVRFFVRRPGKGWASFDAQVSNHQARMKVAPGSFEWRAELIGDLDAVLFSSETAQYPPPALPPPVVVKPPITAPRAPDFVPGPHKVEQPSHKASYALWGTGAAAAVGGGVFLYMGSHAKAQKELAEAEQRDTGRIQSITQPEYEQFAKQARAFPVVGYALIGTAAALVATGAIVYVISPKTQLTVAPNGARLSGTFE